MRPLRGPAIAVSGWLILLLSLSAHADVLSARSGPSSADLAVLIDTTIAILEDAPAHGIDGPMRDVDVLESVRVDLDAGRQDADWRAATQRYVEQALLAYAVDFTLGRQKPTRREILNLRETIRAAIGARQVDTWYRAAIPRDPAYHQLRAALMRLERAGDTVQWPAVGPGPTLQPGDRGARVVRLRARLDVGQGDSAADVFDDELAAAVLAYQHRHGLDPDGLIGPRTQRHLDVTVEQRISQVRSNLERWRRSGLEVDGRHIRVNLPSYELAYRNGVETVGRMRVVIGTEDTPTPMLVDAIRHLVFSPYWYIPQRIALREILPRLERDPGYLARRQLDVFEKGSHQPAAGIDWARVRSGPFPYYLRQRPGPENALGRIKFSFPNAQYIYLHDTASPDLFGNSRRAYSYGCIRVENARILAEWLLDDQPEWDGTAIDVAMNSKIPRRVELKMSVPIITTYFTAAVGDSGLISFYEDVYDHESGEPGALASSYLPARPIVEPGAPSLASN